MPACEVHKGPLCSLPSSVSTRLCIFQDAPKSLQTMQDVFFSPSNSRKLTVEGSRNSQDHLGNGSFTEPYRPDLDSEDQGEQNGRVGACSGVLKCVVEMKVCSEEVTPDVLESLPKDAIDWAREQIDLCSHQHTACVTYNEKLPTRVLDSGFSDAPSCTLKSDLNVYESHYEHGRYACLSHRWGSYRVTCLTTSNRHSLLQRISFNTLPLTFQHAIVTCRILIIRFLWVDSLW